jgi:hypothetical protein
VTLELRADVELNCDWLERTRGELPGLDAMPARFAA